jgi:hypothetical protein
MLMKGPAYVADAYAMDEPRLVSDLGCNKRV